MKKTLFVLVAMFTVFITVHAQDTILFQEVESFPTYIAIDGNTLVASAGWENTTVANKAGAIYIYELVGGGWEFKQRIVSPQGQYDGIFGHSVAISGNFLVVGEPNAQKAHIYTKLNSNWELDTTFNVTDVSSERYGISCAIEDNRVVVGSGGIFAIYSASAVGSAYVYELINGKWEFESRLIPSDGVEHDNFANSLSISNGRIAVGASKSVGYVGTAGYTCVFEKVDNVWTEMQKLYAPDSYDGNRYGQKLEIDNDNLVIYGDGSVYYYNYDNEWIFRQKIQSPVNTGSDGFSNYFKLVNDNLFVSAGSDDEIASNSGAFYIYEKDSNTFHLKDKVKSSTPITDENFCNGEIAADMNYIAVAGGEINHSIIIYKNNSSIDSYKIQVKNDTVSFPNSVVVPISVTDLATADNIISYQFDIDFDNSVLEYTGNDLTGTLAEGGTATINSGVAGKLNVSYMTTTALTGAGDILMLQFNTLKADTTDILMSNAYLNSIPITDLTHGTVIVKDDTPPTAAISIDDTDIRCWDHFNLTAVYNEPMLESNAVKISLSGAVNAPDLNMTRLNDTVYTVEVNTYMESGQVTISLSNGTDPWGNEVVSTPTSGETFSIIPINYGDVDDDGKILAYDAALTLQHSVGLDPLPTIDPLPWEGWRDTTANVDGVSGITANDAGMILQYSAGIITSFGASAKKSVSQGFISIEVINNEIILYSYGDLLGLNISVVDEDQILEPPVIMADNLLSAFNISGTTYSVGICTANSPENGVAVMKIPYTKSGAVTLNMIVNTEIDTRTLNLSYSELTGIDESFSDKIIIYPNPAKDIIRISGLENTTMTSIYSADGKLMYSGLITDSDAEVNVSEFSSGLYIMKFDTNEQIVIKRFAVE